MQGRTFSGYQRGIIFSKTLKESHLNYLWEKSDSGRPSFKDTKINMGHACSENTAHGCVYHPYLYPLTCCATKSTYYMSVYE